MPSVSRKSASEGEDEVVPENVPVVVSEFVPEGVPVVVPEDVPAVVPGFVPEDVEENVAVTETSPELPSAVRTTRVSFG